MRQAGVVHYRHVLGAEGFLRECGRAVRVFQTISRDLEASGARVRPFVEWSYARHREEMDAIVGSDLSATWSDTGTVDYWRHARMYATVAPLLRANPRTRWLTVGDGRFGLDSIRLRGLEPTLDVLPSDIAHGPLQDAKGLGLITDYRVANAEALPFEDKSFDFVFCKEAYHHFPRPMIALHEMIRVAGHAVVMIEPHDGQPLPLLAALIERLKMPVRRLLGRRIYTRDHWNFEKVGNYIYSISQRELEKVCLGLGLPAASFYCFNDYYESGVEKEGLHVRSTLFRRVRRRIWMADWRCRLRLRRPGIMTAILFSAAPRSDELACLKAIGHWVVRFPSNPYPQS